MPDKYKQQVAKLANPRAYEPSPDDLRIYELYVTGQYSFAEVGEIVELSRGQCCKTYRKVSAFIASEQMERIREMREDIFARNRHRYRELMRAWELSKEAVVTVTETAGESGDNGGHSETKKQTQYQVGNVAYLNAAHQCDADLRAMLGLDAATKFQIEEPTEQHERVARVKDPHTRKFLINMLKDHVPEAAEFIASLGETDDEHVIDVEVTDNVNGTNGDN